MSILHEIITQKRIEVAAAKKVLPASTMEANAAATPIPLDFALALKRNSDSTPRLIAEVKFRSPSKGILCPNFDPQGLACIYAQNGAAAISVLTDQKYFGGDLDHLRAIAALELDTPLLRKDFIFDRYQLLEARAAGASAVLLIVAILKAGQLIELLAATRDLGMEALVETRTQAEIEVALAAGAKIVGINNRDLRSFDVCLDTTLELHPRIPPEIVVVAESGIHTLADVKRLGAAGVDAMLIGESLVSAADVAAKVRSFTK